ncbi:MAG: hypothetical protein ACRC1L_13320 [Prochlorococcaceae cyanobacterium]
MKRLVTGNRFMAVTAAAGGMRSNRQLLNPAVLSTFPQSELPF